MKLVRGILLGALLWAFIFIEISVTMIGLHLSTNTVWMIHYLLLIPVVILLSYFYYKSKDMVNGFLLGLVFVVTGVILDMVTTVPLFIIPQGGTFMTYFTDTYLLIGLAESFVIVGLYDLFRKKKKH
jgi:hypothetical protein